MENTGEEIWKSFTDRRIVLAGIDGPEYQAFFQRLVSVSQESGAGFRVLDGVENIREGDYVLLFARPAAPTRALSKERSGASARKRREAGKKENKDWSTPFEENKRHMRWEKPSGIWKQAGEAWEETLQLLAQMQSLTETKPSAVLLISGNEVYGKCFGTPHALRENELGYVCHTAGNDIPAQCMRTAEHFACALAQEQLPVRIGRMGPLSEELPQDLLEACARILLYGADAEIYNLPCHQPDLSEDDFDISQTGSVQMKDAEVLSQTSDLSDEQEEVTEPAAEDADTEGALEPPVRPVADRKIVSFQKKAEAMHRLALQPAATKKSGVQVKTYTEPGPAAAGDRSVLAPMPVVTDTEKADGLGK